MSKKIFYLPLLLFFLFSACSEDKKDYATVTFNVFPEKGLDSGDVFISGDTKELGSWAANKVMLKRINNFRFTTKLKIPKNEYVSYKFTLGSWQTEAVDSLGNVPPNTTIYITKDTVIDAIVNKWSQEWKDNMLVLSESLFKKNSSDVFLSQWKFKSGNNIEWSKKEFDDSKWISTISEISDTTTTFAGEGWFRAHVYIDKSLQGKLLSFMLHHFGASEMYLDGKLFLSLGKIGKDNETSTYFRSFNYRPIYFDSAGHHVIAIRYANFYTEEQKKLKINGGFSLLFRELYSGIDSKGEALNFINNFQLVLAVIPTILFIFHFIMYVFNPKSKQNLYYSFCLLGFSILAVLNFERFFSHSPYIYIISHKLMPFAVCMASTFGLYAAFSMSRNKLPKRAAIYAIAAIVLSIAGLFNITTEYFGLIYVYFGLTGVDILYSFVTSPKSINNSSILSFVGFFILLVFVVMQILMDFNLIMIDPPYNMVYGYGIIGLIVFMSMNLSYNFSQTNKNLEKQLLTIGELNEKTLEQEREAKEQEISTRLLEADNQRKTKELEEARNLQLSMLPKIIPETGYCEIEVYMKTATEVGGDYYDLCKVGDELVIAIGDATGHGAKAGIVVAAAKGLFNAMAGEELLTMIKKFTGAIKSMNFHNLFMALSVLKIRNRNVSYINAAMPPLLIFNKEKKEVYTIIQKSMPLGSFIDFPYKKEDFEVNEGDVILLMSDGFIEAFNDDGDLLGLENCKNILIKNGDKSVKEIIEALKAEYSNWAGKNSQNDDITFIVIKFK